MTWDLTALRARVRRLTGKSQEADISTSDLDDYINEFYVNILPEEIEAPELDDWFSFDTVEDQTDYDVDEDYLRIGFPVTLDGYTIEFYQDPSEFYAIWPETQTYDSTTPSHALLYNNQVILRAPPDADGYEFKAKAKVRPTALSGITDEPLNQRWGPAIAYGTAIMIMNEEGDDVSHLAPVFDLHMTAIGRKKRILQENTRAVPRY